MLYGIGTTGAFGHEVAALYWNVNPSGAIVLLEIATGILNRLRVPFRLKVLLDTSIAPRDAAVLYVPLAYWPAARDIIGPVCRQLDESRNLEAATPLFTKTLRPGVGLAEDPQTGLSFGMHRSALVARSLARSFLAGHTEENQQWSDLQNEFEREQLWLDRHRALARTRQSLDRLCFCRFFGPGNERPQIV